MFLFQGAYKSMAYRLFQLVVGWTLALLFLGSVVHATESSLACPDWPTCYGTMMPEMTGGVFWEHLHRLWAGGLVLIFIAALWALPKKETHERKIFRAGLLGVFLLLVQSGLGGLTVIYRLPDAISISHLSLAFLFLALATVLMVVTGPGWHDSIDGISAKLARSAGLTIGGLVFLQSVAGALVRHTDAGVACPDIPLCLGRIIPPLDHPLVQIHFAHRALGLVVGLVTVGLVFRIFARATNQRVRFLAWGLSSLVVAQILLGYVSVGTQLSPPAVSLHTLFAATLLALAVTLTTYGWRGARVDRESV